MRAQVKKVDAKSTPAKKSRFSFFAEVVAELRKVHWPTKQEALRLSIVVLSVCIIVGVILGALDWAFTRLFFLLGG